MEFYTASVYAPKGNGIALSSNPANFANSKVVNASRTITSLKVTSEKAPQFSY